VSYQRPPGLVPVEQLASDIRGRGDRVGNRRTGAGRRRPGRTRRPPRAADRARQARPELIGLTPGNLITHLRKLEDAGYLRTAKTVNGSSPMTAVSLTPDGRKALDRYSAALRELLDAADAAARR
jgi:hypothetical protein